MKHAWDTLISVIAAIFMLSILFIIVIPSCGRISKPPLPVPPQVDVKRCVKCAVTMRPEFGIIHMGIAVSG